MSRYLYEATRLDFLQHLLDGRISYEEFSLHNYLRCHARISHVPGCVFTSAPTIAVETGHSEKVAQRLLASLESDTSATGVDRGVGYINRFWKPGWRGNYPVLIDKFTAWEGSHEVRINAAKTTDWRHPVMERVSDEGGQPGSDPGGQAGGQAGGPKRTIYSPLATRTTTTATGGPVENADAEIGNIDLWCFTCNDSFEDAETHYMSPQHTETWLEKIERDKKAEASE